MKKLLCSGCLLLSSLAWADPYSGTVYGVYPEGVMVSQGPSSWLIPSQYATFQAGGVRLNYSQLVPGQAVQVVVPPQIIPQVLSIPDPYAWQVKYHPDHPHGGPPGQMKKYYKPGKGKKGGW